jgi:hypothetical protein
MSRFRKFLLTAAAAFMAAGIIGSVVASRLDAQGLNFNGGNCAGPCQISFDCCGDTGPGA